MSSLRIEDHNLQLSCDLLETTLNDCGEQYLLLSIISDADKGQLDDVTVSVGDNRVHEGKHTIATDTVDVTEDNKLTPVQFTRNKFVFMLPQGLCTDDPEQKISLQIDVHKASQPALKDEGHRIAGCRFIIYPRTVPPLANIDKSKDLQLYMHTGLMTFTRILEEGIQVHAGKLRFSVSLRWEDEDVLDVEEAKNIDNDNTLENVPTLEQNEPTLAENVAISSPLQEASTPKSLPVPTGPPSINKSDDIAEAEKILPTLAENVATSSPLQEASTPKSLPVPTGPPSINKSDDIAEAEKILPTLAENVATSSPLQDASTPKTLPLPTGPSSINKSDDIAEAEKILEDFQAQGISSPVNNPRTAVAAPLQPQYSTRDVASPRQADRHKEHHIRPSLVAKPGHVVIVIIVHAASQLPKLPDGAIPKPYVIGRGKGKMSSTNRHDPPRATHASVHPSQAPSWEEMIVVKMKTNDVRKEAVCLVIADQLSKSALLEYELGLAFLKPFHQYHLDLVQSVEPDHQGSVKTTHLFVSVQLRSSQLPHSDAFDFHGLEVTLVAMEESLSNPIGPLTAVARVVPDFFIYMQAMDRQPESSALKSSSVQCPTPHPSSFFTLSTQSQFGHPQWTLPGLPEDHPTWNQTLLFCEHRELASIFTDTAALVIEFYPTTTTFNGNNWSLPQSCGYCSLLLDMQLYKALMSDRGSMGLRVEHISLQLTKLYNRNHKTPSVELVLRLLTTAKPSPLVSIADIDALPTLTTVLKNDGPLPDSPLPERIFGMTPPPVPLHPKRHKKDVGDATGRMPINDGELVLPSQNALENILKLQQQPSPGNSSHGSHSGLIPTRLPPKGLQNSHSSSSGSPASASHSDKYALSLLDSQQKEIDSYKDALKRMGEEIVRLQEEIARIEMENSKYRQRLSMHEDATKAMVDLQELDDLSRADLVDKYVTLRHKLSQQVTETSEYREKLLKLQNSMIKQNDREQQYLKQRDTYLKQQDELQSKHEKIKKLEKTCIEQEKALDKMEWILRNKLKQNKSQDNKLDEVNALMDENVQLKSQVEQLRKTPPAKPVSPEDAEKLRLQLHLQKAKGRVISLEKEPVSPEDAEKLRLQLHLQKAKGRVISLEKELMEKARDWGKQIEIMRLRLSEQRSAHHQRSLPPLPYDRGYSYNLSDDETDDYPSPRKHQRHRHLSPLY